MTVVRVDGRTSYQLRARGIVTERPNKLSIILLSYYVITNQYGSHYPNWIFDFDGHIFDLKEYILINW